MKVATWLRFAVPAISAAWLLGCATPEPDRTDGSICLDLTRKPRTDLMLTPDDAARFWAQRLPERLRQTPLALDEGLLLRIRLGDFSEGEAETDGFWGETREVPEITLPAGHTKSSYRNLAKEIHAFKRVHAHEFWTRYQGRNLTVRGVHYCGCCFFAAIGYPFFKWGHDGWVLRLDTYIAIGLPPGMVCYGEKPGVLRKGRLLGQSMELHDAVGTVRGPYDLKAETSPPLEDVAEQYFVLTQDG